MATKDRSTRVNGVDFTYARDLLIRVTQDHAGPDAILDDWLSIGKVSVIVETRIDATYDDHRAGTSHYDCMWGVVRIDNDKALRQRWHDLRSAVRFVDWRDNQIEQALRDTFSKSECVHDILPSADWPCGCRSETATEVHREYHDLWKVTVRTWFNRT